MHGEWWDDVEDWFLLAIEGNYKATTTAVMAAAEASAIVAAYQASSQ